MAGQTSQPSADSLYYALSGNSRQPDLTIQNVKHLSAYWEDVRKFYQGFESGMAAPDPEVYEHEMPGGQFSNLQQQAKAVGLGNRWDDVKQMYRRVNDMFGDVVKVTPSSKVVGDMALYMVQNGLSEDDVYERGDTLDFPDSVVEFFQGYLGQPYQGFPQELQRIVLKGREPLTVRPGEQLEAADFMDIKETLFHKLGRQVTSFDALSYALYPKVFLDREKIYNMFGDVSVLDTPTFFYGMRLGEEINIEIEQGKTLIVKLVSIGEPQKDGSRVVYFELNGQPREIIVIDESAKVTEAVRQKADPSSPEQIGAGMPGTVIKVLVEKGEKVKKGDHLMITEAMKMETTVQAPFDGTVKEIYVSGSDAIAPGDLLLELNK
jgi:pyruvate carboxylase